MIFRIFASPIAFKHPLLELFNGDDLVVLFLLVEVWSSPDENLMLVVFMAWHSQLGSDAEYQQIFLGQVFIIENRS